MYKDRLDMLQKNVVSIVKVKKLLSISKKKKKKKMYVHAICNTHCITVTSLPLDFHMTVTTCKALT